MTLELACESCLADITEEQYDAADGLCAACLAASFLCAECGERTLGCDVHKTIAGHCETCGDSIVEERHQEALDAAAEKLRELVEGLIDAGDLDAIRKAIKRLSR